MRAADVNPDAGMWQWLAYELRFERQKRGLTLAQVAESISTSGRTYDRSYVAHMEAANRNMRTEQAIALDTAWNTGGRFERLIFYAETSHDPTWTREYATHEVKASEIRTLQTMAVPALLQREEYARAVFVAGRRQDVDEAVASRLARQKILDKVIFWALIDEAVLLRPTGGLACIRDQLAHLLTMSERPNLIIRVVPLTVGAYVGQDGSFSVLTDRQRKDVAWYDACDGGRLVREVASAAQRREEFDLAGADALTREMSRQLIRERLESLS